MGQINDDLHVGGQLSFDTMAPAQKSIPAYGVVHRFPITYRQPAGADVQDADSVVHIFHFAGKVTGVKMVCATAPNGGDKQVAVDVLKGNQGGAYSSILTTPMVHDDAKANRQVVTGVLTSSPTICSAGDSLRVNVDAQGSTGTQGIDLAVVIFVEEDPV